MTAILSILIDEAPTISSDVVDVIVAQFLWADPITLGSSGRGKKNVPVDTKQSTLLRKEAPAAYNMAKNLCNAFPEKMARLFGSYFGSVIVDFASGPSTHRHRAGSADLSDDDEAKGPSEEDINDASKAHRLLRELWRCAPGALQEIIPHLQEELGTENVQLRQLATETFGDMISGIGAAGPPPQPGLDPAAYPSQSLVPSSSTRAYNYLTTPASLNSFPSQYPGAYHSFLSRQSDKSPIIRASWATSIARIIMTSAGGVGLDPEEEQRLLKSFAQCLIDSDDRVRLSAVKAIEYYEFNDIIEKLGSNGGMSEPGSILWNLADRIKDRKPAIHTAAIKLLGKLWGVAAGAIAEGDVRVTDLLGPIPSKILDACYVRDPGITAQVDLTLYEALLPLNYPPMKPKAAVNGGSQVVKDSQGGEQSFTEAELDKIRAERQLVLVRGLEDKAKKVFFANQGNQVAHATYMEHFLKMCEEYNGGVMDKGEKEIKTKLEGLIAYHGKMLPDSSRAIDDLWKFAKAHDRRSYQLIRFCMTPESDYRKIFKSIKELRKRIEENPASPTLLETLTPLLYRVSLLCFNKSHVPAIIEYTRTDDKGLGATAHEILKEISTKHPKVFSTHVKDLCKTLENEAPTPKTPNPPGAVDDLKACASFAKKFPKDVPLNAKESRKLVQSFLHFALYGTPAKAAKHAVTIIMSSDNKKEVHAREILKKSSDGFKYGCDHWLTKLAALSQLVLLAPEECEKYIDDIVNIAVEHILLNAHPSSAEAEEEWMETPDDDMVARTWALRILVNRLLSFPGDTNLTETAAPIFMLFNRIIKEGGEASKKNTAPLAHRNLQRLLAANFLLKLATQRRLDSQISPTDFIELSLVTHDKCLQVRKGFAMKLMKYLGQNRLPPRYYTILFLFAHEPDSGLRDMLMTWIRSRRAAFTSRKETVLETSVFARLLSLVAHHPDFENDEESLQQMSAFIIYYLKCVATEDNLALIFHMAGRVKTVRDAVDPSGQKDENLYILSDLAQALIPLWEDQNGWSMQTFPGKQRLPSGIFKPLESHERSQEIAEKQYIDKNFADVLEPLVRKAIRSKKRKAGDGVEKARKKIKSEVAGVKKEKVKKERMTKTPRKKRRGGESEDDEDAGGTLAPSSEPRRKSGRKSTNKSYVEISSDEDEEEAAADVEGDEEMSDAESAAQEDVEMEEAEKTSGPEPIEEADDEPEPEPEPQPPKRATRAKGAKKTNGVTSSPVPQKRKSTQPVEEPASTKASKAKRGSAIGKGKVNGAADAVSSSPVTSGTVRRSGRNKG